jgi:small subunit ribosomal protein S20
VASGDQAAASLAFKAVEPEVMRAASKGVFHKNTASRKVSRLSARLKSMSA